MLKYVFMGTPPIAKQILNYLVDNNLPPIGVVSQEAKQQGRGRKIQATAVTQYAREKNIPVLESAKISAGDDFKTLQSWQPDIILVAAFGQILRENVLKLPKKGCLNVHASLLPKYRGAAPIQRAIWNGDEETGVSIQRIVKALDAGDVLLHKKVALNGSETSGSLLETLSELGAKASLEALQLVINGKDTYTPQDPNLVTVAPKIQKEDGIINWHQPAMEIERQIRALQPWPVASCHIGEDRLKIYRSALVPKDSSLAPTSIETDGKTYLNVACGRGTMLALLEVQAQNRKRIAIQDYLGGFRGQFQYKNVADLSSE